MKIFQVLGWILGKGQMGVKVMETTQNCTNWVHSDLMMSFCSVVKPIFPFLPLIGFSKILGILFSLLPVQENAFSVSCFVSFVDGRKRRQKLEDDTSVLQLAFDDLSRKGLRIQLSKLLKFGSLYRIFKKKFIFVYKMWSHPTVDMDAFWKN